MPHPPKALAAMLGEAGPGRFEAVIPGHQRPVVVGAEIMDILGHEAGFGGVGDLPERGQVAVGKDIAVDPRVGRGPPLVLADRVQQQQPVQRRMMVVRWWIWMSHGRLPSIAMSASASKAANAACSRAAAPARGAP